MPRSALWLAAAAMLAAPVPALAQAGHGAHRGHGAHGEMTVASTPADGATLDRAPAALALDFGHPMTLQAVALTGPDGRTAAIPVVRAAPSARATVKLPPLAPGAWRAAWKAAGADGHPMTGVVRFTVR